MENFKISNKGSATLFKNSFLEKLTRTNFIVPVLLYSIIGIVVFIYSARTFSMSIYQLLLLFFAGWLVFTLFEYLIHRFLFHFHADTEKQKELQYKIHGVHHHFPKDKDRLAMPVVLSLLLAAIFFFLFMILPGKSGYPFFAGFISGYAAYLFIHYAVHRYRQPHNMLNILWKHHSLHHYKSENTAFGVSNPLWDYIFGTLPEKKSIKKEDRERLPDE
ncbi:MAG: sterol desaturase family protein [Bacteroidetes bacterium]|jgi:sterol desaturase/sphingolipid hydroxylase (fatty acid hydroxylase superfamily)|nr:sterol desaturase family protein [Bacteroidota bacterium]